MQIKIKSLLFLAIFAPLLFFSVARGQSASWQTLNSKGFTPRYGLSSSVIDDKIFVIGGDIDSILEVYDPKNDLWSTPITKGQFPPHYEHTASVVNGKIYIIGGAKNSIQLHDSVYVFDPSTNTWSTVDPGESKTTYTSRTLLSSCIIGDSIYAIGGWLAPYWYTNAVEVFNTRNRTWSTPVVTKDSLQYTETCVSLVINGKIYVVGRAIDTNCHCDVQVYDPETNKWTVPPQNRMAIERAFFTANLINGKIYVIGGQDWLKNVSTDVTEVFNPALGTWSTLSTTGTFTKRQNLTSSVIGNKIYVIGGERGLGEDLNTNEVLTVGGSGVESRSGKIGYNSRVYPNPATTTLNLVSVEASTRYRVIDVLGRVVISGMTLDHATLSLDISSLPRGAYYVLVERADRLGTFAIAGKIVVIDP